MQQISLFLAQQFPKIASAIQEACFDLAPGDPTALCNQDRVLRAFAAHRVGAHDLGGSTGYGYNDLGRDKLEAIWAQVFGSESALVRPQIASGTHALWLGINGNSAIGDHVLAVTGEPYATLRTVLAQEGPLSFMGQGKSFSWVDQAQGGSFDFSGIKEAITSRTRIIYVQKSRGYALRQPVSNQQFGELCRWLKCNYPKPPLVIADNCYGEFVEDSEPGHHGADLTIGSLIKNPGGGLAETGGYLAGRRDLVKKAGDALYAPGLNSEIGPTGNYLKSMFQGLFMAPHHVGQALINVRYAARLAENLGFTTLPRWNEPRYDLVQTVILNSARAMEAFAGAIQAASPIDSYAAPTPGPVPGYTTPVIMAAGTFVQGASLELTCDGPVQPPYAIYLQGGLSHEHGLLAISAAFNTVAGLE